MEQLFRFLVAFILSIFMLFIHFNIFYRNEGNFFSFFFEMKGLFIFLGIAIYFFINLANKKFHSFIPKKIENKFKYLIFPSIFIFLLFLLEFILVEKSHTNLINCQKINKEITLIFINLFSGTIACFTYLRISFSQNLQKKIFNYSLNRYAENFFLLLGLIGLLLIYFSINRIILICHCWE